MERNLTTNDDICFNRYLFLMWRRYKLNIYRRRILTRRNSAEKALKKAVQEGDVSEDIKAALILHRDLDNAYISIREQLKAGTKEWQKITKPLKIHNNWDSNGNIQSFKYMKQDYSISDYKPGHDKYITEYMILYGQMPTSPFDRKEVMNEF